MDYRNQFPSDDLKVLDNYDVFSEESSIIIDNVCNENELLSLKDGVNEGVSVISKSTIVDGDLTSETPVALNGRINGNIRTSDDLGVGGLVVGDLAAENIHMQHAGIHGNVTAVDAISIEDNSIIVGDVSGNRISIDSKVKGTITASSNVEFRENSLIVGEVVTSAIHMDENARVNATITLVNKGTDRVDDNEFDLGV